MIHPAWGPGPGDITINDSVDGRPRVGWRPLRGTGELTVIDPPDGVPNVFAAQWSRDGRFLLGVTLSPARGTELAAWSEADGWTFLTDTPAINKAWPSLSPDGRWIAYIELSASGTSEVFVRPFGREGAAELVADARSVSPIWSPDGTELYFQSILEPDADADAATDTDDDEDDSEAAPRQRWVMAVSIAETPDGLDIGRPQRLFDATAMQIMSPIGSWDVGPDGRFLMSTKPTDEQFDAAIAEFFPQRIRVVQHWAAGLDAAAGP